MENQLIKIDDICAYHHIEFKFIQSLEDFGLIQTTIVKKTTCLDLDQLSKLEHYLRLRNDLDINLEGIHAVSHLLQQVSHLQEELTELKNELNYYKQIH